MSHQQAKRRRILIDNAFRFAVCILQENGYECVAVGATAGYVQGVKTVPKTADIAILPSKSTSNASQHDPTALLVAKNPDRFGMHKDRLCYYQPDHNRKKNWAEICFTLVEEGKMTAFEKAIYSKDQLVCCKLIGFGHGTSPTGTTGQYRQLQVLAVGLFPLLYTMIPEKLAEYHANDNTWPSKGKYNQIKCLLQAAYRRLPLKQSVFELGGFNEKLKGMFEELVEIAPEFKIYTERLVRVMNGEEVEVGKEGNVDELDSGSDVEAEN